MARNELKMATTCQLTTSQRQSHITADGQLASQVNLVVKPRLGPKKRFVLLSDSCGFADMGRPLWREDVSAICRGHSQRYMSSSIFTVLPVGILHSHLSRSRFLVDTCYFASWVLIHFLWWPVFCLLLPRPHWAVSWSAEISLRLLWTCLSEMNCLH
jgi:hypothetical protein